MTENIQQPIHQFRYSLTREDIAAFEFLPRELQGLEKLWLFGPVLACGAAAGLFEDTFSAYLRWDPTSQAGQIAVVLIAIAAGYALSLALLTARARYRINAAPLPQSQIAIDAFTDRFTVTQDGAMRSCPWRDVSVIETGTHVFLAHGPRQAIIIPLRAFQSADAMHAFASYAETNGSDAAEPAAVETAAPHNNNKETMA